MAKDVRDFHEYGVCGGNYLIIEYILFKWLPIFEVCGKKNYKNLVYRYAFVVYEQMSFEAREIYWANISAKLAANDRFVSLDDICEMINASLKEISNVSDAEILRMKSVVLPIMRKAHRELSEAICSRKLKSNDCITPKQLRERKAISFLLKKLDPFEEIEGREATNDVVYEHVGAAKIYYQELIQKSKIVDSSTIDNEELIGIDDQHEGDGNAASEIERRKKGKKSGLKAQAELQMQMLKNWY